MGRDAFILIEKVEAAVGSGPFPEALRCALVCDRINLRTVSMSGKPAWGLEVLGWWVPLGETRGFAARAGAPCEPTRTPGDQEQGG